jgi:hypothetical protein
MRAFRGDAGPRRANARDARILSRASSARLGSPENAGMNAMWASTAEPSNGSCASCAAWSAMTRLVCALATNHRVPPGRTAGASCSDRAQPLSLTCSERPESPLDTLAAPDRYCGSPRDPREPAQHLPYAAVLAYKSAGAHCAGGAASSAKQRLAEASPCGSPAGHRQRRRPADPGIPRRGNQVWTNLIGNAIDAMAARARSASRPGPRGTTSLSR